MCVLASQERFDQLCIEGCWFTECLVRAVIDEDSCGRCSRIVFGMQMTVDALLVMMISFVWQILQAQASALRLATEYR